MTSQRLFPSWLVWLLLVATPLSGVASFVPTDSSSPQPSDRVPGWVQSHGGMQPESFKETSSFSQEFSLQSERQSKKVRVLIRRLDVVLQDQHRAYYLQSIPDSTTRPIRFFFPRKLSPPQSADEPFVS